MNFTGGQDNRAFRTDIPAQAPYHYISAYLDLKGLHTGQLIETDPYIFYFNRENNFNYLNRALYPSPDNYGGFYMIDENSIIGEVTVYANPSIIYEGDIDDLKFEVGGVYKPSIALDESLSPADLLISQSMDVWGGPTGNVPGEITVDELENGQVCYYGREPADPQANPENEADLEFGSRRYLALRFVSLPNVNAASNTSDASADPKANRHSARPISRRYRPRPIHRNPFQRPKQKVINRQVRVLYDPLVEVGMFHVVVKVFPKSIY
jgi:hypothetical protein